MTLERKVVVTRGLDVNTGLPKGVEPGSKEAQFLDWFRKQPRKERRRMAAQAEALNAKAKRERSGG